MNWQELVIEAWWPVFRPILEDPRMQGIMNEIIKSNKRGKQVFPHKDLLFNAFNLTPPDKVKVVILGQDPYIREGQAMGLAFSVPEGIAIPPSLRIINRELERSYHATDFTPKRLEAPESGDLSFWAKQGVLLLNTALTVEEGASGSHSLAWMWFTKLIIMQLSRWKTPLVFLLWGKHAQQFRPLIMERPQPPGHEVFTACHPQAENYGSGSFTGCNHFIDTNKKLERWQKMPVIWSKFLYNVVHEKSTGLNFSGV